MKIPAFDTHRFSSEQSPRRPPARRRGIGRPPDRDQSLDGAFLTWRAAVPRSREPDRDLGLRRTSFPERTKSPASSAAPRDRAPSRSGSKLRSVVPDLEVGGPSQSRKNQNPSALGRLNGGQGDGVDDVINECPTGQIVYRPLHTLQHRSDTDDMCATLHGFVGRVSRV